MNEELLPYALAIIIALILLSRIYTRLQLSQAKHSSLRGHAKWSRRIARLVPYFAYDKKKFFNCDGAPDEIVKQRKDALKQLNRHNKIHVATSRAFTASVQNSISDVMFTNAYRVPFPFREQLPESLKTASIVKGSEGVQVIDVDGNRRYDVFGSYGVNVFGYDFYKQCIERGSENVSDLGPVLGPYHPVIRDNVEKLKQISGLDEVSFHMSGTEAVMQAVRLARYHTGKTHLVRFCGAYHGWWDGVQPGVGNQRQTNDVYTLADVSDKTLRVLRTRKDIACVLVNPLQALHPNSDAPSDASLVSSSRSANFDRQRYTAWLQKVRKACSDNNIVLIFDEVFTGFRLGYRGAQEYFGIQADIVTYGKTLGGGLPIGVVCGRHDLMKRFRDEQPANISFARGTFNSHPYVMAAMNEFLTRIEKKKYQKMYRKADAVWNKRVQRLNDELAERELPVKVVNMHSILTIIYTLPSRYNWMFQFYLRREGLELGWIGSGRLIMSLNYTDEDFDAVSACFVKAAEAMNLDGWWWQAPHLNDQWIKRQMLKDMLLARVSLLKLLKRDSSTVDTHRGAEEVHER